MCLYNICHKDNSLCIYATEKKIKTVGYRYHNKKFNLYKNIYCCY